MTPNIHWRHRWEAISAQPGEFAIVKGAGTAILYRCERCNQVKSDAINGYWTLDQIGGVRERT